jgi:stage II sporulation protein R
MKRMEMLRSKGRAAEAWVLLGLCVAAFLLALLLPLTAQGLTAEEEALLQAAQRGEVIRLHILAEDDTPKAQAIKLAVRDAVLAAFGRELAQAGAEDAATAFALLQERRAQILRAAQAQASACGFDGPVTAEAGILHLPPKLYGDVLLPEGEYRGLRITLGKGEGQNWWCVLFPQLCLSLAGEEAEQWNEPHEWEWKSLRIFACWPLAAPAAEGIQP